MSKDSPSIKRWDWDLEAISQLPANQVLLGKPSESEPSPTLSLPGTSYPGPSLSPGAPLLHLYRYHNNTLLDPSLYKHESKLVLRNLQQDQAGEYFCKAQSDAGAVKSKVTQLTVIGKPVWVGLKGPRSATVMAESLGRRSLAYSVMCIVPGIV